MSKLPVTPQAIACAIQDLLDENARLREQLGSGRNLNAKKLSRSEVREIRRLKATTSLTQRALAEMYDVNPATVSRIVRGQYHRAVA